MQATLASSPTDDGMVQKGHWAMRNPSRLKRKFQIPAAILAMLMLVSPGVSAQAVHSQASLTLTQALALATQCGPAFRDQARLQERQRLNALSEQNAKRAAWQLSAGASVKPDVSSGAVANMTWKLSDSMSLRLNLPLGTPGAAASPPTSARKSLALDWSHTLWPADDRTLQTDIQLYQLRVAELELRDHYSNAVLDVINSFHDLQASISRTELAERSLHLAQAQTNDSLHRYENGLIGLDTLHATQRLHHQAQVALQRALLEQEQAFERFTRIAGGDSCLVLGGARTVADLRLDDDLDWDALAYGVASVLDVPRPVSTPERGAEIGSQLHGSGWQAGLLSHSTAYARARVAALQSKAAFVASERRLQPAMSTAANINSDLESAEPDWSIGIHAVWDLGPNRHVERNRAQLDLEAAEDNLAQASSGALEAGRAAWLAVSDAMYALELAESSLEESRKTEEIVQRRVKAGLAPAVEADQARLEVDRRALDYGQALVALRMAWLKLGNRLGLGLIELD